MNEPVQAGQDDLIGALFQVGAHFGYSRSRRHPTAAPYIFGVKNRVEIIDLEKVREFLARAEEFMHGLGSAGKTVLWVGGKVEAREAIRAAGERLGHPYVDGRWIGGTLTNFGQIRSRVEELLKLREKRVTGELSVYTKRERLLIDRKIEDLERMFLGIVPLASRPAALFIVDPGRETVAFGEAKKLSIPVAALAGSDCDLAKIEYPVLANDAARASITFFVNRMADAYAQGKALPAPAAIPAEGPAV